MRLFLPRFACSRRLCAMVAAIALAVPTTALAADPDAATVSISVDDEIDDATEIQSWISKEVNAKLGDLDVQPKAEAPWRIGIDVGGATYDYRVEFTVQREGDPLADAPKFACECTNEQLLAKIQDGITAAVDDLRAQTADAPIEDNPTTDKQRVPLGKPGKAGIALIVVGTVGVGVGAGLLGVGKRESDGDLVGETETQDFRTPGIAVLAIGGAALLTGVALLVVDRVKAKRTRTALAPSIGPTFAGANLSLRF